MLKFAAAFGATSFAATLLVGLGSLWKPQRLVVIDLRAEDQPFTEVSYVNPPTSARCNTDPPLHCVDIAIKYNNKGAHSVTLM